MEHLFLKSRSMKKKKIKLSRFSLDSGAFLPFKKNNPCTPLKPNQNIKSKFYPSNIQLTKSSFLPKLEESKLISKKNNCNTTILIYNKNAEMVRIKKRMSDNKNSSFFPKINQSNSQLFIRTRKSSSFFKLNNNKKYLILDKNIIKDYYALSMAGKDHNGRNKINQDSYLMLTNINGITNYNVFAIFDGHGTEGHLVSQYLVKYFKNFFETNSQLIKGKTETDIYNLLLYSNYKLIRDAIQECEKKLSNEEDININSSGSTLCMIIQLYQKIICVNVGDSRAILSISEILRDEIKILSIDHKPSLKKEQERIKNCGGFVKSIDSNGQLRVWDSPLLKSPGLALSRSIGDLDAAKIGVIAEPDFWMKSVKKEMNFIVIASDGIWEFLSNKEVCDIVKKFYLNGNPKEAAEELVKKAREIWEKKGKEIDDITTIIIFL